MLLKSSNKIKVQSSTKFKKNLIGDVRYVVITNKKKMKQLQYLKSKSEGQTNKQPLQVGSIFNLVIFCPTLRREKISGVKTDEIHDG